MKSLKEQSCIEIIKRRNLSLHDFFLIINNPTNAEESLLKEACSDRQSPIWKFLIDRDYTPTLLLSRMDISPENYYDFARRLAQNIVFYYVIVGDWGFNRTIEGPFLIGGDENFDPEGDTRAIKFQVLGAQPKLGSIGYVVQFYFDDPIYISMSNPQVFILGPGYSQEDVAELYLRMKLYLAAHFKRVMLQYLDDLPDPDTGEFNHTIEGRRFNRLATDDELNTLFDEILTGGAVNMAVFPLVDPGVYRFQEYIIGVRGLVEDKYLTMFFDVGQIRFD